MKTHEELAVFIAAFNALEDILDLISGIPIVGALPVPGRTVADEHSSGFATVWYPERAASLGRVYGALAATVASLRLDNPGRMLLTYLCAPAPDGGADDAWIGDLKPYMLRNLPVLACPCEVNGEDVIRGTFGLAVGLMEETH